MTYTTLKTDIAEYLHRDDLTAKIPAFILLAESMMFRAIDLKDMETTEDGVTTGGYADIPADFSSLTKITITTNSVEVTLDYMADPHAVVGSVPSGYSYEAGQIRLWGAATGQAYKMYYKAKLSNLSSTVATNWLLDNGGDLYLYASALEGAKYIKDQTEIAMLSSLVSALVASVKSKIERMHYPSSAGLQIRAR